jgi:hypothetical protein
MNAVAGATTVTFNFSASTTSPRLSINEYSGVATSTALDKTSSLKTDSQVTSHNTGTAVTTTANGELIYAFFGADSTYAFTIGSGFSFHGGCTGSITACDEDKTGNIGSYQGTITTDAAADTIGLLATFKPAAVPENWQLMALLSPVLFASMIYLRKKARKPKP